MKRWSQAEQAKIDLLFESLCKAEKPLPGVHHSKGRKQPFPSVVSCLENCDLTVCCPSNERLVIEANIRALSPVYDLRWKAR